LAFANLPGGEAQVVIALAACAEWQRIAKLAVAA
jgi:hypothetical protein